MKRISLTVRIVMVAFVSTILLSITVVHSQEPVKVKKPTPKAVRLMPRKKTPERQELDVNLGPNMTLRFNVPLQQNGTMVSVKYVPDEQQIKQPAAPTRVGAQSQVREVVTVRINAGRRSYWPIESLGDHSNFVIRVNKQTAAEKTGLGILTNLTGESIRGKLLFSSMDAAEYDRRVEVEQKQALAQTIQELKDPDLLWVLHHTLRRHLADYQKTELEKQIAENVFNQPGFSRDFLVLVSEVLNAHELTIKNKLKNVEVKRLSNMTIQQSLTKAVLMSIMEDANFGASAGPAGAPAGHAGASAVDRPEGYTFNKMLFGAHCAFESSLRPNTFIAAPWNYRNRPAVTRIGVKHPMDELRITFIIRESSLSGSKYLKFESYVPKYYMINQDDEIVVTERTSAKMKNQQFERNFSFNIVPSLNGKPFPWVSIESVGSPDNFIHCTTAPYEMAIGNGDGDQFKEAATFIIRSPFILENPFGHQLKDKSFQFESLLYPGRFITGPFIQGGKINNEFAMTSTIEVPDPDVVSSENLSWEEFMENWITALKKLNETTMKKADESNGFTETETLTSEDINGALNIPEDLEKERENLATQITKTVFKIVPGHGDNRFESIASLAVPDYYMTDWGQNLVRFNEYDTDYMQKLKSTYRIVPALTGDDYPSVSIETSPGYYVVVKASDRSTGTPNYSILLERDKRSDRYNLGDKKSATFILHDPASLGSDDLSSIIKDLESEMQDVGNKRREATTAFENFDQKANQLLNILSTVMKSIHEMHSSVTRNML